MDGPTFWSAVAAIGTCIAAAVAVLTYRNSRRSNDSSFPEPVASLLSATAQANVKLLGSRFTRGAFYTREQIHQAVGGSVQSYLPHFGGRIVAACLRPDTNPDAPSVILPGTGEGIERAAALLVRQLEPVPTFLKRGSGRWQYVGEFVAGRWSRDREEIAAQSRRSGRRDITMVIHMLPANLEAEDRGKPVVSPGPAHD